MRIRSLMRLHLSQLNMAQEAWSRAQVQRRQGLQQLQPQLMLLTAKGRGVVRPVDVQHGKVLVMAQAIGLEHWVAKTELSRRVPRQLQHPDPKQMLAGVAQAPTMYIGRDSQARMVVEARRQRHDFWACVNYISQRWVWTDPTSAPTSLADVAVSAGNFSDCCRSSSSNP